MGINKAHLYRLFLRSPLAKKKWVHFLLYQKKKKNAPIILKRFMGEVPDDRKQELLRKMRHAMICYRWNFEEFFLFGYENLSKEEIASFAPEFDKNIFCAKVNDEADSSVFYYKWNTYSRFKKYYRRDVVQVRSLEDLQSKDFLAFIDRHHRFILKPESKSCGRGIRIINTVSVEDAKQKLEAVYRKGDTRFVLEELVVQSEEMARLHPESVNTVRFPTFRLDDRVHVFPPYLRMGQGSSFVDNAGSGGVFGLVSLETGRVYAACDEMGNTYEVHPNTKEKIIGFVVPRWEEAIALAKELITVVPTVRWVGWDLALTDDGWVLIEGNERAQFVFQIPDRKGCRKEVDSFEKAYSR
jgi:hypothetical protein